MLHKLAECKNETHFSTKAISAPINTQTPPDKDTQPADAERSRSGSEGGGKQTDAGNSLKIYKKDV